VVSRPVEMGDASAAFDEMAASDNCRVRYDLIRRWSEETPPDALALKRREAELLFRRIGITFAVYSEGGDPERLIPFDIVPRVLDAEEWALLSRGLTQRVSALNDFIRDVYHGRQILRAGLMPPDLVLHNEGFRPEMQDFAPAQGVYTHIAGIDIVRLGARDFCVLEDNCRTPSGVSYMLENREAMMRLFPELFARHRIAPVRIALLWDRQFGFLKETLVAPVPRMTIMAGRTLGGGARGP